MHSFDALCVQLRHLCFVCTFLWACICSYLYRYGSNTLRMHTVKFRNFDTILFIWGLHYSAINDPSVLSIYVHRKFKIGTYVNKFHCAPTLYQAECAQQCTLSSVGRWGNSPRAPAPAPAPRRRGGGSGGCGQQRGKSKAAVPWRTAAMSRCRRRSTASSW